jgi:hypothetical protein
MNKTPGHDTTHDHPARSGVKVKVGLSELEEVLEVATRVARRTGQTVKVRWDRIEIVV